MDVVRPQSDRPGSRGCLRGLVLLLLALLLAALAVAAAGYALLALELGGIDGPAYAVVGTVASGLLAVASVAVLVHLVRRR